MPDKRLCTSQSRHELRSRSVSKSLRRVIRKSKILLIDEKGQSLVEFALVTLFIILPVVFGIIEGSILLYKWVAIHNAAREGARAGAIYQDSRTSNGSEAMMLLIDGARENSIVQAVDATIGPLASRDDWSVSYPDCDPVVAEHPTKVYDVYRGGCKVSVTITHTHSSMVGLVIGVEKMDLTATATMRIEPGGVGATPPP